MELDQIQEKGGYATRAGPHSRSSRIAIEIETPRNKIKQIQKGSTIAGKLI